MFHHLMETLQLNEWACLQWNQGTRPVGGREDSQPAASRLPAKRVIRWEGKTEADLTVI